jgi:hypothetical protein
MHESVLSLLAQGGTLRKHFKRPRKKAAISIVFPPGSEVGKN